MNTAHVRLNTHLVLVIGQTPEVSQQMYWGQVSEKLVGEIRSLEKFRMFIYSKSRPEIQVRTELCWTPRISANMPMPLSAEDAPEWQMSGRALQSPRLAGPGVWTLDVKKYQT